MEVLKLLSNKIIIIEFKKNICSLDMICEILIKIIIYYYKFYFLIQIERMSKMVNGPRGVL